MMKLSVLLLFLLTIYGLNSQEDSSDDRLTKIENDIKELKKASIPVNFIYITDRYSGLFFRAQGGDSEDFGMTQDAGQPTIDRIRGKGFKASGIPVNPAPDASHTLEVGKETYIHPGGVIGMLWFHVSGEENRPINTAIRIWKRIE